MHQLTANAALGPSIAVERPPHRLQRLRAWMDAEGVDCVTAFGTDNVNYLGGYWRYYGGPSALVIGRDGDGRSSSCATRCRSRSASVRQTRRRLRRARVRRRAESLSPPGRGGHLSASRRDGRVRRDRGRSRPDGGRRRDRLSAGLVSADR